jgi:hypothetical protein
MRAALAVTTVLACTPTPVPPAADGGGTAADARTNTDAAAGGDRGGAGNGCRGSERVVVARGPISHPRIAYAGNQFGVTFLQYGGASELDLTLRLARLSSSGQLIAVTDVTSDVAPPDPMIDGSTWPSLSGAAGRFVVAYASKKREIVLREVGENGAVGAPSVVATAVGFPFTTQPTIGATGVLVTWVEVTRAGRDIRTSARRILTGLDLQPRGPAAPIGGEDPLAISADRDPSGGFVVAWLDTELRLGRMTAAGELTSRTLPSPTLMPGQARPVADVASGGSGFAVTLGNSPDGPPRLHLLRSDGAAVTSPFLFDDTVNAGWPPVAWDGARYLVAIAHFPPSPPGKTELRIEAVEPDATRAGTVSYDADPWDDLGTPDVVRGGGASVGAVWPHRTGVDRTYEVQFALVSCE